MLFNSHAFILVFLPLTLALVLGLSRLGARGLAKLALFAASLFFYGYWSPKYVFLLLAILATNYATAQVLLRLNTGATAGPSRVRTTVLGLGLLANVGVLGYFKYTNFAVGILGSAIGHKLNIASIALPLGISFITFQKVALLVDVYSGTVPSLSLLDYCLFVTFFPQLIAGPIVHHREVIPQFARPDSLHARALPMAAGVTLFVIGLAKKVLLADALAPAANIVYDAAAAGAKVDFFSAWSGAVHYMLQLYFDFSGYSDMAIGLGMMFGVVLPFNFNSPYKAVGFVDYWQRWHMTLTRFLTAYVYNPLVLRLTRRRMASGKKSMSKGRMTGGAFVVLLALPTMFTMFISGVWHGAGFQFIAQGLLHGVYLVIDHGVRTFRKRSGGKPAPAGKGAIALARVLTLLGVLIGTVLFRADSLHSAARVLKGMIGASGTGVLEIHKSPYWLVFLLALIAGTQFLPNSQELMGSSFAKLRADALAGEHAPGQGPTAPPAPTGLLAWMKWRPALGWGIAVAAIGVFALVRISEASVFLYFNF